MVAINGFKRTQPHTQNFDLRTAQLSSAATSSNSNEQEIPKNYTVLLDNALQNYELNLVLDSDKENYTLYKSGETAKPYDQRFATIFNGRADLTMNENHILEKLRDGSGIPFYYDKESDKIKVLTGDLLEFISGDGKTFTEKANNIQNNKGSGDLSWWASRTFTSNTPAIPYKENPSIVSAESKDTNGASFFVKPTLPLTLASKEVTINIDGMQDGTDKKISRGAVAFLLDMYVGLYIGQYKKVGTKTYYFLEEEGKVSNKYKNMNEEDILKDQIRIVKKGASNWTESYLINCQKALSAYYQDAKKNIDEYKSKGDNENVRIWTEWYRDAGIKMIDEINAEIREADIWEIEDGGDLYRGAIQSFDIRNYMS